MCLYTNQKEPLVAKEDIVVYKLVRATNNSIHQVFPYRPNTLYRLRRRLKPLYVNGWPKLRIEEGFHSFVDVEAIRAWTPWLWSWFKTVKFTIPKGAKYFLGDNGDIVSTSIRSGNLKAL